jgi:hypothetical protein
LFFGGGDDDDDDDDDDENGKLFSEEFNFQINFLPHCELYNMIKPAFTNNVLM